MCGLTGIYFKNSKKRVPKKAIEDLIYVTQLRGMHSAGIIYAFQEKDALKIGHKKKASLPYMFVKDDHTVNQQIGNHDNKLLAFHCRAATKGKVTDENSHPFKHGNIVLMHNGTLRNEYQLNNKYFEVDSEAVCAYLAEEGNTPQSFVDKASGAYALVWADYRGGTLNFLRNDDRPLYFASNDDMIVWASEKSFIEFVNSRHDLKLKDYEEFPIFTHRKINMFDNSIEEVKLKAPPKEVENKWKNWGNYYSGWSDSADIEDQVPFTPQNKQEKYFEERRNKQHHQSKQTQEDLQGDEIPVDVDTLAGRVKYFHKIINNQSYPYATIALGSIVSNPMLPSVQKRAEAAWEIIDCDDSLQMQIFDPEVALGHDWTVSILNTRVIQRSEKEVTVEFLMPVYHKDIEQQYPNMTIVMPRIAFAIARRNQLLVQGNIRYHSKKEGTIVLHGGRYITCFDPVIQGQLSIGDISTLTSDIIEKVQ